MVAGAQVIRAPLEISGSIIDTLGTPETKSYSFATNVQKFRLGLVLIKSNVTIAGIVNPGVMVFIEPDGSTTNSSMQLQGSGYGGVFYELTNKLSADVVGSTPNPFSTLGRVIFREVKHQSGNLTFTFENTDSFTIGQLNNRFHAWFWQ